MYFFQKSYKFLKIQKIVKNSDLKTQRTWEIQPGFEQIYPVFEKLSDLKKIKRIFINEEIYVKNQYL